MHSIFSPNVTRSIINNKQFCKSIVFEAIVRREPSGKSNMFVGNHRGSQTEGTQT